MTAFFVRSQSLNITYVYIEGQGSRKIAFTNECNFTRPFSLNISHSYFFVTLPFQKKKPDGLNSCPFRVYKYQAQTKIGSISLKSKACKDIHVPPRSGAEGAPFTLTSLQLLNSDQCNDKKKIYFFRGLTKINMTPKSRGLCPSIQPIRYQRAEEKDAESFLLVIWENRTS